MRSCSVLSTARNSAKLDTVLPWDIEMTIEDPEDACSEDAKNEDDAEDPDAEDADAEDADAEDADAAGK